MRAPELEKDFAARPPIAVPGVRIYGLVGRGATGRVYKGFDTRLNLTVAVKMVRCGSNLKLRRDVLEEARQIARLSHPNLVRVYRCDLVRDWAYIVMDYISGETLEQRLNRLGPQPPEVAAAIMADVFSTLDYLHAQLPTVVHMDVSPVNIMMGRDQRVWLMDMGMSITRRFRPFCEGFAAMERMRNAPPDPSMDVFAAGAVLAWLMTGRPAPIVGGAAQTKGLAYAGLIRALLDPDPSRRPSAAEAYAALTGRTLDGRSETSGRLFWYLMGLASGLGFAMLAAGGYVLWRMLTT